MGWMGTIRSESEVSMSRNVACVDIGQEGEGRDEGRHESRVETRQSGS